MKDIRLSKGVTEHYTSFEEMAKAWHVKPIVKQTKDKAKLEKQRETFSNKHLCSACKSPMTYIGGNQMVCQNEKCSGIKHETKNKEDEVRVWYTPSFELLDNRSADIAENIFANIENE